VDCAQTRDGQAAVKNATAKIPINTKYLPFLTVLPSVFFAGVSWTFDYSHYIPQKIKSQVMRTYFVSVLGGHKKGRDYSPAPSRLLSAYNLFLAASASLATRRPGARALAVFTASALLAACLDRATAIFSPTTLPFSIGLA
jgi:hypothetical protein